MKKRERKIGKVREKREVRGTWRDKKMRNEMRKKILKTI